VGVEEKIRNLNIPLCYAKRDVEEKFQLIKPSLKSLFT
jgi:hypothetical protein